MSFDVHNSCIVSQPDASSDYLAAFPFRRLSDADPSIPPGDHRKPLIVSEFSAKRDGNTFQFRQFQEYGVYRSTVLSFTDPFAYQSAFRSVEVSSDRQGKILRRVPMR